MFVFFIACGLPIVEDTIPEVNPNLLPVACFNFNCKGDLCIAPTELTFNSDCSQNADKYIWTFGQGDGSLLKSPSINFQEAGSYTISLTVEKSIDGKIYSDDTLIVIDIKLWECGDPIIDERDGQIYETLLVGEDCWIKNNMNYNVTGSYCYDHLNQNCEIFGRLYSVEAVTQRKDYKQLGSGDINIDSLQGICPKGWHIMSDTEWDNAIREFGSGCIGYWKLFSPEHWTLANFSNNESGLGLLPGGFGTSELDFEKIGELGSYWGLSIPRSGHTWISSSCVYREDNWD